MILKYKLSDGRIVPIDENDDNAIKLFQEKLKEKNLTAELITDEPGKSQGANQPQNNQQLDTESPSEDTSSELQSTEPILRFGATGPYYEDPVTGNIIKPEDLNIEQKEKINDQEFEQKKLTNQYKEVPNTNKRFNQFKKDDDGSVTGKVGVFYETTLTGQPVQVDENTAIELDKIDKQNKTEEELSREKYKENKINNLKELDKKKFDILDPEKILSGILSPKSDKSIYMNKPTDLVVQLKALIGDEKDGFTYEFVDDSGETFL